MPGNLLFANKQFPQINGGGEADLKAILNYLYMLQEELRYTMGNLSGDNFNDTGLVDLSNVVTADLSITVQSVSDSVVTLTGTANAQAAELVLMARYTGMDAVVTLATTAEWNAVNPKDEAITYYVAETQKYWKYVDEAWVSYDNTPEAITAEIALSASETEGWVTSTLTGYYTSAAVDLHITDLESSISQAALYGGSYTTVSNSADRTDKALIYKWDNKYWRWNGTAWVEVSIPPVANSIASINSTASSQGANITLLAGYSGMDGVVTVATSAAWTALTPKVTTTVYYVTETDKYMKHNGTDWVACNNISEAAFTVSAINGQSSVNVSADRIDFTGFTTFATTAGLADGTTTVNGGCLGTDTVATDALKVRTESSLDWLDFYAGIDMTVIDVEDESYYPDTRQLKGVKSIRLYKDTDLTSGHGDTGNTLQEIGSLQVNTTGIAALSDSWSTGLSLFMVDTDYPTALELSSGSGVAISSGKASGQSGPIVISAYHDTTKTSGYVVKVTKTGIDFIKYVSGTPTLLETWS